jgi:hypothetical protein
MNLFLIGEEAEEAINSGMLHDADTDYDQDYDEFCEECGKYGWCACGGEGL